MNTEPQTLEAELVEIGNDEDGTPRLIFIATREQIAQLKRVPLYRRVMLTMEILLEEEHGRP